MANQAAKKTEQRIKDFRKFHGGAILVVALFYALIQFGLFYSSWERFHTYAFSAAVGVAYVCYSIIFSNLEGGGLLEDKGGWTEPCRDSLYIILFTQTIAVFSDSCWYITVIIPLMMAYKIIAGYILPWFTGGGSEEEDDIQLSKTQQKKQRRAEKFGGGGGR